MDIGGGSKLYLLAPPSLLAAVDLEPELGAAVLPIGLRLTLPSSGIRYCFSDETTGPSSKSPGSCFSRSRIVSSNIASSVRIGCRRKRLGLLSCTIRVSGSVDKAASNLTAPANFLRACSPNFPSSVANSRIRLESFSRSRKTAVSRYVCAEGTGGSDEVLKLNFLRSCCLLSSGPRSRCGSSWVL